MNNTPYHYLSLVYNHLMRSIDYSDWTDYIIDIYYDYNETPNNVLELASGNCLMGKLIFKKFSNIILTDNSLSMLQNNSVQLPKVCCSMTSLPFKNKYDLIFSTFDSINYLTEKESLEHLFLEVKNILSENGIFTFDASLEKNSIINLKRLNRKGKFNGIKYKQKSEYDKLEKIHYNFFELTLESGQKIKEIHKQRIYDFEEYFEVIYNCGLIVRDCYEAFTFVDANNECERVQFIVQHKE